MPNWLYCMNVASNNLNSLYIYEQEYLFLWPSVYVWIFDPGQPLPTRRSDAPRSRGISLVPAGGVASEGGNKRPRSATWQGEAAPRTRDDEPQRRRAATRVFRSLGPHDARRPRLLPGPSEEEPGLQRVRPPGPGRVGAGQQASFAGLWGELPHGERPHADWSRASEGLACGKIIPSRNVFLRSYMI